jgi:hypothetical protein
MGKEKLSMNNEDKIIQLAFSIYSNPGIYSLLIGSGVSRSAEIPTGWEIMFDLIRKIGVILGEQNIENPEKWYREKFNEEPSYSNLLSRVAKTEEERKGILREYFEPNEDELREGKKLPTKAHKAIANMVKEGYIRVILTTNFDRLLERALEEAGVSDYQIISTSSKIKGMTPYTHRITIFKLHGDYLDGEMKNTSEELSKYSRSKNKLLNNIFEDFGLIVSGWSAEYDIALRDSLHRRKNRRYSTYWTDIKEPKEEANELIGFLQADLIGIEAADDFFEGLEKKIEALKEYNQPHPLSAAMAIEEAKKYIESNKYIKLDDFVRKERKKIKKEFEINFYGNPNGLQPEELVNYCFQNLDMLLQIVACISYHSNGNYKNILISTVEEFTYENMNNYEYLPVLAIIYTGGILSLLKENYENLFGLLVETKYRGRILKPLIEEVYAGLLAGWVQKNLKEYKYNAIASSTFLSRNLEKLLGNFVVSEKEYKNIFDLFEFLYALVYLWLTIDDINSKSKIWAPVGLYNWHFAATFGDSYIKYFINEKIKEGNKWSFLKAGFFDGKIDEFNVYYKKYIENAPDIWG